ncbi:WD40-repeat-containing domain protein [Chiua virens]|nr:WD40-repeat-containing domain protein [Chiua virens]
MELPSIPALSLHGTSIACAYGTSLLHLDYSAPQGSWSKIRRPLASPSTLDDPPLFAEDSGDNFTAVAMTLDTTVLVTSSEEGTIKIWNTSPRNSWKNIQGGFKRTIEGFWPTPDGRNLLVKPLIGLQLIASTGAFVKDLETGGDTLGTVGAVPSPDSRYFAFWQEYTWNVDKSFSIYIYNASTGVRIKRIPGFFDITTSRFSAESDLFACAHGEGIVQVWELPSAVCKTTINTGHAAITALEFLSGNITLVVGSDAGCVEIRLVESGEVMHRVVCAPSKVLALAVPIGALIVIVGHEDGSLFVWDPSYTTVAPHCLSSETSSVKETSDDAA